MKASQFFISTQKEAPADAEIVIEGYALKDQLEADGPFGEYTGYLGGEVQAPTFEVRMMTVFLKSM